MSRLLATVNSTTQPLLTFSEFSTYSWISGPVGNHRSGPVLDQIGPVLAHIPTYPSNFIYIRDICLRVLDQLVIKTIVLLSRPHF